ncbi:30S ribosome-binding factor RbfA [bacterium]|nr:30S ribosome-binding factor RbfA [bacterium]
MSGSIRTEKVAQTIRETLMHLLLRDVADPRIKEVIITDVKVSKDLHWVYYDTRDGVNLAPQKKKEIEKGLSSASSFFRRKIGEAMVSKFTPELRFKLDTHTSEVNQLLGLMEQIRQSPETSSTEE